jgi:hypothetical protein
MKRDLHVRICGGRRLKCRRLPGGRRVVLGTGEILLGPGCGPGVWLAYNRRNREVAGCREEVGGGSSSADRRDNTTRRERRAPASSMRVTNKEVPG